MSNSRRGLKRLVGGIYSTIADGLYEPLVVQGAFRLFGGRLNELILELQTQALTASAGQPVLDMPTGTGYFTIELAGAHDGLVVASDLAPGMLKEAGRAAERAELDNVALLRSDAHHLPFADGCFGLVFCWNGLQVIPGLDETVAELARVLAPGGRLLVSVVGLPVGGALPGRTSRHLPAFLSGRRRMAEVFEAHGLHVISVTAERFASIFDAAKPSEGLGR